MGCNGLCVPLVSYEAVETLLPLPWWLF